MRRAGATSKRAARSLPLETGLAAVLGHMGADDLKVLYQRMSGVSRTHKSTVREKQLARVVQLAGLGGQGALEAFLKQKAVSVGVLRRFLSEQAAPGAARADALNKAECVRAVCALLLAPRADAAPPALAAASASAGGAAAWSEAEPVEPPSEPGLFEHAGRMYAHAHVEGKSLTLGPFESAVEAAHAYEGLRAAPHARAAAAAFESAASALHRAAGDAQARQAQAQACALARAAACAPVAPAPQRASGPRAPAAAARAAGAGRPAPPPPPAARARPTAAAAVPADIDPPAPPSPPSPAAPPPAADEALLAAAAAGDEPLARALLRARADPRGESAEGWSALIRAAAGGHGALVSLLLDAGAPPNPRRLAHTALRAASLYGHDDVCARLLAARADPNLPSAGLRTPLMGAALARTTEPAYSRAGTLALAARLLRARAAVDAANDGGETALALALSRADEPMAALLLEHGADPRDLTQAAGDADGALGARLRAAAARLDSSASAADDARAKAAGEARPPRGSADVFVAAPDGCALRVRLFRSPPTAARAAPLRASEPPPPPREPPRVLVVVVALHDVPARRLRGADGRDCVAAAALRWCSRAGVVVAAPDLGRFAPADSELDGAAAERGVGAAARAVAAALSQLRGALGCRAVVLVGTGWGAAVAARVGAREPAELSSAGAANPGPSQGHGGPGLSQGHGGPGLSHGHGGPWLSRLLLVDAARADARDFERELGTRPPTAPALPMRALLAASATEWLDAMVASSVEQQSAHFAPAAIDAIAAIDEFVLDSAGHG